MLKMLKNTPLPVLLFHYRVLADHSLKKLSQSLKSVCLYGKEFKAIHKTVQQQQKKSVLLLRQKRLLHFKCYYFLLSIWSETLLTVKHVAVVCNKPKTLPQWQLGTWFTEKWS